MENTQENEVVTVDNETVENTETADKVEKTFTQEQVNEFLQKRIASIYGGYGAKDKAELDAIVEKAKGYDDLKSRYDSLEKDHYTNFEKLTFMENNISPTRYDDIRAYFKGKEIVFNAENLLKELETHQEWLNVPEKPTTTVKVGHTKTEQPKETDKEKAFKLFGV
jgi:hypothetical protein